MGSGFRVWTAGEVVSASNVNNYLQEQVVMVFAGTAARSSALPTPSEGMVSYRSDDDAVEVYDGSDWVGVGGAQSATVGTTTGSPTIVAGTVIGGETYDLYTFTGSGSITLSKAGLADVLLIGGGGSGAHTGGGGGAGQHIEIYSVFIPAGTWTATIGGGGAGATSDGEIGKSGTQSSLTNNSGDVVAFAVGGGPGSHAGTAFAINGGSGGGGGYNSGTPGLAFGSFGGNNGGTGGGNFAGGGGGGAGAVGANASGTTSGAGGNGKASSITGTSVTRAGGGGGAGSGTDGAGGSGGGGAGNTGGGTSGTANTGGGGGATSSTGSSGAGGSGLVIVRVKS